MFDIYEDSRRVLVIRIFFYTVLVLSTGGLILFALIYLVPGDTNPLDLQMGNVAPHNIEAPYAVTFESEFLTSQQRETAAQAVLPVYTSPDTSLARMQVDQLRATINFISATRADTVSSLDTKLIDLASLETVSISPQTTEYLLMITDAQWQAIQQESVIVLQQVMRNPIRDTQLDSVRSNIPNLVSFAMSEEQARVVSELVSAFVVPNSIFSEEMTRNKQDAARNAVPPVFRSFVKGETVVQGGKVITQADVEALQQLGLLTQDDANTLWITAGTLVVISFAVFGIGFYRQPELWRQPRRALFIAVMLLLNLFLARLVVFGHPLWPYMFPAAGFGLVIAGLFGLLSGVVFSLPLGLLVAFGSADMYILSIYYVVGSMFGVLILGKARRTSLYFWAGFAVTSMGAAVILAYRLVDPFTNLVELASLLGASFFNGIVSSGLAILLLFFGAQFLGMTSPLKLVELSRPDQPLLRFVLLNAPGTYQHSLQVANLAEQAAELIGADPMLTRVGALYHDIGKTLHPQFFIENQVAGAPNIHDTLSPEESAEIIIRHVTDGLKMAKKHRLPIRIQEFIAEHHGTMVTRYQYIKAVQAADGDHSAVDLEKFHYPGPKPKSRETALVMLADGCEARVRAERPASEDKLRGLIVDTVRSRLNDGQLDDVSLTTKDLTIVMDSFATTLRAIYHPRIEYPKLADEKTQPAELQAPERVKELPETTQVKQTQEASDSHELAGEEVV